MPTKDRFAGIIDTYELDQFKIKFIAKNILYPHETSKLNRI